MLHKVSDIAGVCEIVGLVGNALLDHLTGLLFGLFGQDVLLFLEILMQNVHQLVGRIILKEYEVGKPGLESRIGIEELLHQVGISCNYHDQLVSVILHGLKQFVHSFLSEVAVSLADRQRICFIYKEDATKCFIHDLLNSRSGLSDEALDHSSPVNLYQLSPGKDTEIFIYFCKHPGYRGLACTGITGKDHMLGHVGNLKPLLFAHLLDPHQINQRIDLMLDTRESRQSVKFGKKLLELCGLFLLTLRGLLDRRLDGTVYLVVSGVPDAVALDEVFHTVHVLREPRYLHFVRFFLVNRQYRFPEKLEGIVEYHCLLTAVRIGTYLVGGICENRIFEYRRYLFSEFADLDLTLAHGGQLFDGAVYPQCGTDHLKLALIHIPVRIRQIYGKFQQLKMQHLLQRHLFAGDIAHVCRLKECRYLI